jgi:hypothetical protein
MSCTVSIDTIGSYFHIPTSNFCTKVTGHRSGGPTNDHCIGIATSSSPDGPFTANSEPHICNLDAGGVIDPSGFQAPGGALYLLWKVDGNSIGKSTPIMMQHVGANGYDLLDEPIELITNGDADGGLVEAPSMVYWDGCKYQVF